MLSPDKNIFTIFIVYNHRPNKLVHFLTTGYSLQPRTTFQIVTFIFMSRTVTSQMKIYQPWLYSKQCMRYLYAKPFLYFQYFILHSSGCISDLKLACCFKTFIEGLRKFIHELTLQPLLSNNLFTDIFSNLLPAMQIWED